MNALGLIETIGLTAAIHALDVAMKSSDVNFIGHEKTKGGAMIVLKIEGDVGAVKSAVETVRASLSSSAVYSTKVISRPSSEVSKKMIRPFDKRKTVEEAVSEMKAEVEASEAEVTEPAPEPQPEEPQPEEPAPEPQPEEPQPEEPAPEPAPKKPAAKRTRKKKA